MELTPPLRTVFLSACATMSASRWRMLPESCVTTVSRSGEDGQGEVGQGEVGQGEIGQGEIDGRLMLVMKDAKFHQNGIRSPKAWMPHGLITGQTGIGQPTEPFGGLDSNSPLMNSTRPVDFCFAAIIRAVTYQIVSDPHQCASQ
jgi:hypothetical protein